MSRLGFDTVGPPPRKKIQKRPKNNEEGLNLFSQGAFLKKGQGVSERFDPDGAINHPPINRRPKRLKLWVGNRAGI